MFLNPISQSPIKVEQKISDRSSSTNQKIAEKKQKIAEIAEILLFSAIFPLKKGIKSKQNLGQ
jgi:hypothetical protein